MPIERLPEAETLEAVKEERDRYRGALEALNQMQGEVRPIINYEVIPIRWVLDITEAALGLSREPAKFRSEIADAESHEQGSGAASTDRPD